jgi:hypothetical protein
MNKETEEKVRNVISEFVTPLLISIVGILVGVIGWFARGAYTESMEKQDTLIVLVQEVKTSQAVFNEKIKILEKDEEITEKELAELRNEFNKMQIRMASFK